MDFLINKSSINDPMYWWKEYNSFKTMIEIDNIKFNKAKNAYYKAQEGEYYDVHFSVFTPKSFLLLLYQMNIANLLPFKCTEFYKTDINSFEFNCVLEYEPKLLIEDSIEKQEERINLINLLNMNQDQEYNEVEIYNLKEKMNENDLINKKIINKLNLDINKISNELNIIKIKCDNLIIERDMLLNSRSWRFMKPMRDLGNFIRQNKIMHLFVKGLLSVKRIGIIKTIKEIKYYLRKKSNYSIIVNNNIPLVKIKETIIKHTESVDIIICIHNAYKDVKRCIESVYEYTSEPYNIILVDDGSIGQTKDYLASLKEECPNITLIRNEQGSGYTRAANQGLRFSKAEYCVLLNSDTIVTSDWLDKMIKCQKSNENVGIVGPLSNTASWQSVPHIFNDTGDWAKNELPDDNNIDRFAELIELSSAQIYPKLPLLNGFCLLINRAVINKVGYLDEENFGSGFAEEDDYNIRTGNEGFKLAIADDTYIYHAQSKSYSDEKRKILCNENGIKLKNKHGNILLDNYVHVMRYNYILDGIRERTKIINERENIIKKAREQWEGKRVLFILPVKDSGGGGNVIIQEAYSMIKMGVDVWLYNFKVYKEIFEKNHPNLNIPVLYGENIDSFLEFSQDFDIICSTLYSTIKYCDFKTLGINTIAAYYIQDFEPFFFKENDIEYKTALNSYTTPYNVKLITKSDWNRAIVKKMTGAKPFVIGKSVDLDNYRPRKLFINYNKKVVTAMVRPNSPRREPELTLNILNLIAKKYKNKISIFIFGSNSEVSDVDKKFWNSNYINPKIKNLGLLNKNEMVSLLSYTDIFADFSSFQAMGLTALEAMASGCGVIVPKNGGSTEFVFNGKNGIVVDTSNKEECVNALCKLIDDNEYLNIISSQAIKDSCEYYPEKCAYNFLNVCFGGLEVND